MSLICLAISNNTQKDIQMAHFHMNLCHTPRSSLGLTGSISDAISTLRARTNIAITLFHLPS